MFLDKLLEKNTRGNASFITVQLLKTLKVQVTSTAVTEIVENHPDYPSLFSISDSLKSWKIDNLALQIEPETLDKLPVPFIAHTGDQGGKFVLVNSVNGTVTYIDGNGKTHSKEKAEFIQGWNGNVLLAEAVKGSGQKNYRQERMKEVLNNMRIPFVLLASIGLILLSGIFQISEPVWSILFQAIKLIGVVISGLILLYELDKFNPLIKHICQAGKKLNCRSVLGSKHAKLFNLVGWSEIGFFYFAGGFLYLLLGQGAQLAILGWLNLAALPYIGFSVIYQWRIARQWCLLCLTVMVLLTLEGVLCYFNYWKDYEPLVFSVKEWVPLVTSFSLPVLFWIATKKVYIKAIHGERYKKEALQFKYNKEIFYSMLSKQKAISPPTEGLGIIVGNPSAKNTIIKVCNPYCAPCSKAHPIIDELLEHNDVKVQIIFTANNENSNSAKPVQHLMALYEKGDQQLIQQALADWYSANKKDYKFFANRYLLNGELEKQGEKLQAMSAWCQEAEIRFTPTFFINGYQLPEIYRVEDLKHLL